MKLDITLLKKHKYSTMKTLTKHLEILLTQTQIRIKNWSN